MGIKEFRNLYFEVGGEQKWEKTWARIVRFNDKNKSERKIKFRVYDKCRNKNLFIDLVNKLNEVDGGGWEFVRLGGQREYKMNLNVYWDIKKYYKEI